MSVPPRSSRPLSLTVRVAAGGPGAGPRFGRVRGGPVPGGRRGAGRRGGRGGGGGLVLSPESVRVALAMARAGAGGETAAELDAALRPPAGGVPGTLRALAGGGAVRAGNRVWVAETVTPAPAFARALRRSFGAAPGVAPFAADPEAARRAINAWVGSETGGEIADLLTPGTVTAETRLALVNALHLRAAWADDFSRRATEPGPFTTIGGGTVPVPLMRKRDALPLVLLDDGTAAVRLRFAARPLAFTAVLPPAGADFAAFEARLTPDRLAALLAGGVRRDVRLFLPRFRAAAALELGEALRAVGVRRAFARDAQFGPMTADREPLAVGLVAHAATIAVDEDGTEAAAATAVLPNVSAAPGRPDPPPPHEFRADRPFLFAVTDARTGGVLFLGRYTGGSRE